MKFKLPWTKETSVNAQDELGEFARKVSRKDGAWQEKTGRPASERPGQKEDLEHLTELQAKADEIRESENAKANQDTQDLMNEWGRKDR